MQRSVGLLGGERARQREDRAAKSSAGCVRTIAKHQCVLRAPEQGARAIELLTFARVSPFSWLETKERAERWAAERAAGLPPAEVAAAEAAHAAAAGELSRRESLLEDIVQQQNDAREQADSRRKHYVGKLQAAASLASQVESGERHTVKPWFAGKIGESPPVIDPKSEEFPLLGGRIDYVGGRRTAVVVYGHRKHIIDVFMTPGLLQASGEQLQGYALTPCLLAGQSAWIVSDIDVDSLRLFSELIGCGR